MTTYEVPEYVPKTGTNVYSTSKKEMIEGVINLRNACEKSARETQNKAQVTYDKVKSEHTSRKGRCK